MSWPVLSLDSIKANVPYACVGGPFGSNLTSKHYVDEGVPVIRGQNLGGPGCFNETGFVYVTPEKADKLRPNLAFRGDLLFTQRGTLGQVGLIPQDSQYERYVVSQSQMKLTVDASRVDARFVYQYFRLPSTIQEILNRTITAGVPHINLGILKAFEIPLPPLSIQRAIAEVAQAYDDLIATNQRRIALLEDAARRLYREWFVHLRFPGHESVSVKDGVPEGWPLSSFGENVLIRKGKNLTKSSVIAGEIPVVAAGLEPMCYHNIANAEGPVITISASGANAGYVKLYHKDIWASDCSYISNDVTDSLYFLYCALKDRQEEILFMQKGAAQPHVYPKDIQAMEIFWPGEKLVLAFQSQVSPLFEQCATLLQQSQKLAQARDVLLPKLMFGQLDVSGIALPDEVAA